jgi:hypothetical protein
MTCTWVGVLGQSPSPEILCNRALCLPGVPAFKVGIVFLLSYWCPLLLQECPKGSSPRMSGLGRVRSELLSVSYLP